MFFKVPMSFPSLLIIFFLERLRANTRVIKKLATYKYINCSKLAKKMSFFSLKCVKNVI
jgi:hypothetical protein